MPSKIIKLIIPFLIALVIYIIVYNFMDKEVNNIFNVVKYSWYIYELLILCTLLIICKMTNLGILDIVLYNFSSILFVVVFLKFYYYIKLYKINTNKILKMIGSASLEIYIYHGLILEIIANYISNGYVGLGLILSISIFISLIINKVDNSINKLVDKCIFICKT